VYPGKCWSQGDCSFAFVSAHGNTSRRAPCQPKPVAHESNSPNPLRQRRTLYHLFPLTSENQDHCIAPLRSSAFRSDDSGKSNADARSLAVFPGAELLDLL